MLSVMVMKKFQELLTINRLRKKSVENCAIIKGNFSI